MIGVAVNRPSPKLGCFADRLGSNPQRVLSIKGHDESGSCENINRLIKAGWLTLQGRHRSVANPPYGDAMPKPMTLDLLDILEIADDDVTAVVNAYMTDPECGLVSFGEGYRIDPAAACST